MRCVITVLGKDRTGIVAGVSGVLLTCQVNIDDISQTIMNDLFSMIMQVTLDEQAASFNEVQEKLDELAKELNVQITIQRLDVFDYMYTV